MVKGCKGTFEGHLQIDGKDGGDDEMDLTDGSHHQGTSSGYLPYSKQPSLCYIFAN